MAADVVCVFGNAISKLFTVQGGKDRCGDGIPESRTSMTASLLGVEVESRRAERASRLMRGSVAIDIEDILVFFEDRLIRKLLFDVLVLIRMKW